MRAGKTSSRYSSTRRLVRPGRPDKPARSSAVRSDGWDSGTGRPGTRYRRGLVQLETAVVPARRQQGAP